MTASAEIGEARAGYGYPDLRHGWWAAGVFALAAVLSYTDRQILAVMVDPIRADLGITDTQLSIVQGAAFAVLYSCIGVPLGIVADNVRRRALLIAAVLTWSAGTAACGLAHSFTELLGARLVVALGEAALAPAVMSMLADFFPPARRGAAISIFLTGMIIGAAASIMAGSALLAAAQAGAFSALPFVGELAPWRMVLTIAGAAGLLVAALLATIKEPARQSGSGKGIALGELFGEFRARARTLSPLYAGLAIATLADYALMSWLPAVLTRLHHFTAGDVASYLGGTAILAALIGTPAGGAITDWVTARYGAQARPRLVLISVLCTLPGTLTPLFASAELVLVSLFFWALMSAVGGTAAIATILDLWPHERRGVATSTIAFCNTIVGLSLGPTLVALATDYLYGAPEAVGLALTTVMVPAMIVACVLFVIALRTAGPLPRAAEGAAE